MKIVGIAEHSQFSNTYGGLLLVKCEDGNHYLEMGDCFGPTHYGPLTDEQISAFYTLCKVKVKNDKRKESLW